MNTTSKKRGRPQLNSSDYEHIRTVIRKYREAAHMEQKEVAEALGYTKSAIGNWELGNTRPDVISIPKLCKLLNIPLYELFDMEPDGLLPSKDAQVLSIYRELDTYNQKEILRHMTQLVADQERRKSAMLREHYTRMPYSKSLSPAAGTGVPMLDYAEMDKLFLPSTPASMNSDLILKVNGDSMSPAYPDQSLVFVNTSLDVPVGEVGIFIVDGELFIKELHADRLYSLNRDYPDILFTEDTDVRTFGKVMGICDDDMILKGEMLASVEAAFDEEDEC